MFGQDFYPTPASVIEKMLEGQNLVDKIVLEPSAGKGNIVDALTFEGVRDILAAESNEDLRTILATKCNVIANDFFIVTGEQISHVDFIIMNPPFSADEKHILHAFRIAPPGCIIIALCNAETLSKRDSRRKRELSSIVETHGDVDDLGDCFVDAERKTDVYVSLIKLTKPGIHSHDEFAGFYTDDTPEEQANGLMPYNIIRDLVNRYIGMVKIYDMQLEAGIQMNMLSEGFYSTKLAFTMTEDGKPKARNQFKKDLQKAAWQFIFEKLNLEKYSTTGLMKDINHFVERQTHFPFTMKNIYRMLEIVIGTTKQRMDRALVEVFDRLTAHHHDNRFHVEGWKTNSHFMLTEKFILPWMVETYCSDTSRMRLLYNGNVDIIQDMVKAICYLVGMNYDDTTPLRSFVDRLSPSFGQWYCWGFFSIKGFKKGTMHFKFESIELWAKFNQRVAEIKGFPLFEPKEQTDYQKRQTGREEAKM